VAERCPFFIGEAGGERCGQSASSWPGLETAGCGRTWVEHMGELPEWRKTPKKVKPRENPFET